VNGVAVPGTIRPTAFPANCEHATGNHPFEPNAILLTSHRQTELATSNRSTRTPNRQSTRSSERHDEKTESRLGNNR
jgi:hypothetical protein